MQWHRATDQAGVATLGNDGKEALIGVLQELGDLLGGGGRQDNGTYSDVFVREVTNVWINLIGFYDYVLWPDETARSAARIVRYPFRSRSRMSSSYSS